jgi:hypothetical protein
MIGPENYYFEAGQRQHHVHLGTGHPTFLGSQENTCSAELASTLRSWRSGNFAGAPFRFILIQLFNRPSPVPSPSEKNARKPP